MTLNAGSIEFIIKADTEQLLVSNKQVDRSLGDLETSFDKASRSVEKSEKAMFSFSKAALAVSSALSAGAIIKAVDDWGQMAARIKMALKSVEGDVDKYSEIQDRFLKISNRNGKAVETVQSLYAGSATSMKELGYNTEQTIDYIESLSSAFTANATGSQQTESAMNALNRAMVVGTLRGNDWHSVLNATPSVVGDIAKELSRLRGGVKVTENDVKKMALETGISMKLFVDSARNAKDANNALADSMDNTVADGFTKLINSAKAYYGEMNQTLGITRSVSAGFAVLTENFDKVSSAITAMVAIGAAKYFGSLANSMKNSAVQTLNQSKAFKENANAQLEMAQQAQRRAAAEVKNAQLDRARLQNNIDQNKRSQQSVLLSNEITAAQQRERAAKLGLVQANNAVAASQERINAASAIGARAVGVLKSAMALVGGPAGVAMLAGGALLYYWQQVETARQKSLDFADSIEELKNKMKELSDVALMGNVAEASNSIDVQREAIEKLQDELEILRDNYKWTSESTSEWQNRSKNLSTIQRDIAIKTKEVEEAQAKLAKTIEYVSDTTGELTTRNKDLYDAMNNASGAAGKMGGIIGVLQQKIKAAADEKERLNNAMRDNPRTDDGEKAILNLKEQNELLGIQDKRKRAIRKAEMEASKLTSNDGQAKDIVALATANYDLAESDRERSKESKASSKTTDTATEAIKRQVAEIERLNKSYEDGSKQLAQYDAGKALGDKASPEQIAQAERLAGELFDIQQRLADKRAALEANVIAKAERLKTDELAQIERQLKAGDISFEESQRRRLEIASEYATKIAEATASNIITPVAENRAKFDPVQALQNENTRKLALMREYYTQEQQLLADSYAKQQMSHEQFTAAKQATDMQYRALITAMDNQYQQQQTAAQWELMRNQSLSYEMLASAVDSFAGNASNVMTGLMTGTMSAADAMRSLGNTILNSVVNSIVQVGVEMLKNFIISKTMGVAAQAANAAAAIAGGAAALAAWTPAAIAASIATGGAAAASGLASFQTSMLSGQAMSLLGGRRYGGNVSGGNPYRINESGESEIFQTYDGKQAFIPNKSGKVIPADKANGSKGINVSVIFNDYSSGNHQFEAQATQNGDTLTVQAFLTDMHEKGPMHRSITQNTTANTRL
ncbi:tape measure protein [Providencia heimbachae]|uniref:tape measure protein n=1 Tax=Providencia heimbachae TaxID=333962 RepID=UPI0008397DA4|nr:tape measure protein [Providencia heimbachae]